MEKFPRGKGQLPRETKLVGVKRSLNQELLFGQNKRLKSIVVEETKTRKRKASNDSNLESTALTFGWNFKLTAKDFTTNVVTLAAILSISPNHAKVSLPNGYIGTLIFDDLRDESSETWTPNRSLNVHQVVRCSVVENSLSTNNKRQIILSMSGLRINRGLAMKHLTVGMQISGIITSEEDHGFIVQTGIAGVNFFLAHRSLVNCAKPAIGSYLNYIVHDINEDTRVVQLHPFTPSKERAQKTNPISIQSVFPGLLLSVVVEKKTELGLVVNYMDSFKGFIDRWHLESFYSTEEWKQMKMESTIINARVLMVDKAEKWVKLTMRPHLLSMRIPDSLPPLGSEWERLQLLVQKDSNEFLLKPTDEGDDHSATAFLLPQNECDTPLAKEGDIVGKVRVLGYHLMEGFLISSNRSEKLNAAILHRSQVEVGAKFSATITEIRDFGLIFSLNNTITALCPLFHISDSAPMSGKLQKRFKVGQVLTVRVWEVSDSGIIVTLKKSFVDVVDSELLKSYDQVTPAKALVGMVGKPNERGLPIRFFNKLKAFLPKEILEVQGIKEGISAFREGQILRVTVVAVELNSTSKNAKITVCLDLDIDESKLSLYNNILQSSSKGKPKDLGRHEFISGTITAIFDDHITVATDDGRLGILEKIHLFDFCEIFEKTDLVALGYVVGGRISDALVIEELHGKLILTQKPLLLKIAARHKIEETAGDLLPSEMTDLHPGEMVVGFIRKVEAYGVIVQFKNGLTGLAPRPSLSDKFIASPVGIFNPGNSIRCMVQRVDLHKQRVFVSFKSSIIPSLPTYIHSFFQQYLLEKHMFTKATQNQATPVPDWKTYRIGSVVKAAVYAVQDYGVIFVAPDNSSFLLAKNVEENIEFTTNQKFNLLIVDLDFESSVLLVKVITDKSLLKRLKRGERSGHHDLSGEIVHVTRRYAVVLADNVLGYLCLADYHIPNPDTSQYAIGGTISDLAAQFGPKSEIIEYPHQNVNIFTFSKVQSNRFSSKLVAIRKDDDNLESVSSVVQFLKVGKKIECEIKAVNIIEMTVEPLLPKLVSDDFIALVHIASTIDQTSEEMSLTDLLLESRSKCANAREIISPLHPFYNYRRGMKIECVVVHIQKAERFVVHLKISSQQQLKTEILSYYGDHQIKANQSYEAVVTEINSVGCTCMFSPYVKTELAFCDISDEIELVKLFQGSCFVGLKMKLFVHSVNPDNRNPKKVTITASRLEGSLKRKLNSLQPGNKVIGILDFRYHRLPNPPFLSVILPGGNIGRVCVTELADKEDWVDLSSLFNGSHENVELTLASSERLKQGTAVECIILESHQKMYEASLRKSRLLSLSSEVDGPPRMSEVVKGFVTFVSEKGCFVRISRSITGRVLLRDLSDSFVEKPEQLFQVGSLVSSRVLNVDSDHKIVQLSLKASALIGEASISFKEGDVVAGTVHRVTDFGVFVKLIGSSLVGLARRSCALDDRSARLNEIYENGDAVKAKILSISPDHSKISLDLRRSVLDSAQTSKCLNQSDNANSSWYGSNQENTHEEPAPTPDLPITWENLSSGNMNRQRNDDALDDPAKQKPKRLSARDAEMNIRSKELDIAEGAVAPQSVEEFERLVVSNPNSSFVWIQYFSFYAQTADFESAKIIGRRALKMIHFREEEEKLNVWLALLGLEYKFGTSESLQSLFNEAIKENKAKSVYLGLAQIYEKNGELKSARLILGNALKSSQFRKSKKIWIKYLETILKEGDSEGGKRELSRALQSLSPHKHVETISRYALCEYESGSESNGRVLFEDLVASYPKRSDLWFVYIDQETKRNHVTNVRQLFNRIIAIPFSNKVMKTIFKKFLAFEVQYGNESTQEEVKGKAKAFVERSH